MGSEEKADQELGESRILLMLRTPKLSSMLIRLLRDHYTDDSLLTCKTNTVGSDGSLTINLSGGKPFVCPLNLIRGGADSQGLLHSSSSSSCRSLPVVGACMMLVHILSYRT